MFHNFEDGSDVEFRHPSPRKRVLSILLRGEISCFKISEMMDLVGRRGQKMYRAPCFNAGCSSDWRSERGECELYTRLSQARERWGKKVGKNRLHTLTARSDWPQCRSPAYMCVCTPRFFSPRALVVALSVCPPTGGLLARSLVCTACIAARRDQFGSQCTTICYTTGQWP